MSRPNSAATRREISMAWLNPRSANRGARQRHRNDQVRTGFCAERIRQSRGKWSCAGKVAVILQLLDQYRGGKFIRECSDNAIEEWRFVEAAAAKFSSRIGYRANRTMCACQSGQAVATTLAQAILIAAIPAQETGGRHQPLGNGQAVVKKAVN